jgi:type IV secretion system protein TrbL
MSCSIATDVITQGLCPVASTLAGGVANAASSSVLSSISGAMADAANQSVKYLVTGWTNIATPGVSGGTASWLQGMLTPLTTVAGAIAVIFAAVRMAWQQRVEPGKEIAAALFRLVVISGGGLALLDVALQAGDAFSRWIINTATPTTDNFGHLVILSSATLPAAGLLLILAVIAILASLIQIFLLIAREGLIVVLGGTWPLAAATSASEQGKAWFQKTTGWLVAFVLFKPVASIVYAAALRLSLSQDSSGLQTVEGVMLFVMAVLALPALMRLAVPAVSAIGGVSAGKVAAGAAVLATGAVALSGRGFGGLSGGAGGGGASPDGAGPSGSAPTGGGSVAPSGSGPAVGGAASASGFAGGSGSTAAGAAGAAAAGPAAPVAAAASVAGHLVSSASRAAGSTTGEEHA